MYKLKDSIKAEKINIIDHLELLLPTFSSIGLFTFQNGIQNKPGDFHSMGEKIIENLPESPLCIGFYNATNGVGPKILKEVGPGTVDDLERMLNEWELNFSSVLIIRQMLATFAKILSSIKSRKILWTHIAHSEAGLIAEKILTNIGNYSLFQQHLGIEDFLKDQVITLAYGPVAPIPDVVHFAINNYSRDDITMVFAKLYLDKSPKPATKEDKELRKLATEFYFNRAHFPKFKSKTIDEIYQELKADVDREYISKYPHKSKKNGYTLTIIESEIPKNEQAAVKKDHDFAGATYQNALTDNIDFLRGRFGIHDCR